MILVRNDRWQGFNFDISLIILNTLVNQGLFLSSQSWQKTKPV